MFHHRYSYDTAVGLAVYSTPLRDAQRASKAKPTPPPRSHFYSDSKSFPHTPLLRPQRVRMHPNTFVSHRVSIDAPTERASHRCIAYLPDVLARVGEGDLVDLVGVEPDLALSALEYGCGKPLLELQRHLLRGASGTPKRRRYSSTVRESGAVSGGGGVHTTTNTQKHKTLVC